MRETKYRKTEISFSFLLLQLFGQKSYSEIKGYQNITLIKKYYIKLINSFKHAINETINITDKNQITSLFNILNNGEKKIKSCDNFNDIDQAFITIQTKMILQLLGQIPNHSREKNIINKKENWKLNSLRQIQYVQNTKHKELMVFKLIQEKYIDRFGDWSDFVFLYYSECNNEYDKLIKLLKDKHPDIYMEI